MKKQFAFLFLALVGSAAGISAMALYWQVFPDRAPTAIANPPQGWSEVSWPLAKDQFPAGKAFECGKAACGYDVRVTFRAKIGFCNCATGVSDDEELERIGDVDLVGASLAAQAPGREISAGHMKGRSRLYISSAATPVLSIAFNDRCDVIVATATGADMLKAEPAVLEFLNSAPVMQWAERALGL